MAEPIVLVLEPRSDCRTDAAAWMLAQLVELHGRLEQALAGSTRAELNWQIAPGANTVGMLAAHIAVGEVLNAQVGLAQQDPDIDAVLGVPRSHDGMPLGEGAPAPEHLADYELPHYLELLRRALGYTLQVAPGLESVDQMVTSKSGKTRFNQAWVMHHLQEHLAGHLGQIQMLRRLYAQRGAQASVSTPPSSR